jgi:AcrR family transcriptional regulator
MARTVNAQIDKVRRDAFLDVAQRFIQTKGYEQMSIQDVLDELDASRGALYHYFDSKRALLDGVRLRRLPVEPSSWARPSAWPWPRQLSWVLRSPSSCAASRPWLR